MNDPSKMYKLLEALTMCGQQESLIGEKTGSNTSGKQIISPSYQGLKKCNDQCVDCFLTFCRK